MTHAPRSPKSRFGSDGTLIWASPYISPRKPMVGSSQLARLRPVPGAENSAICYDA